jgi:thiamine-phosphate pyrophosphorylase
LVADSGANASSPLLPLVEQAVAGGVRGVWLREKDAAPDDRRRLAAAVADLLHGVGGVLVASPGPGDEYADGFQLAGGDPVAPGGRQVDRGDRRDLVRPGAYGRSCHNRADLVAAAAEGCGWATLSPVFASPSKPGYGPALGPGALAVPPLPTWALGGVDAANAGACLWAGASGVAVMGAILASPHPQAAAAELVDVVAAAAQRRAEAGPEVGVARTEVVAAEPSGRAKA